MGLIRKNCGNSDPRIVLAHTHVGFLNDGREWILNNLGCLAHNYGPVSASFLDGGELLAGPRGCSRRDSLPAVQQRVSRAVILRYLLGKFSTSTNSSRIGAFAAANALPNSSVLGSAIQGISLPSDGSQVLPSYTPTRGAGVGQVIMQGQGVSCAPTTLRYPRQSRRGVFRLPVQTVQNHPAVVGQCTGETGSGEELRWLV